MAAISKGKELLVTLGNRVGSGAEFFSRFKEAEVNVVASSCFQNGGDVQFSLVPDKLERAREVLRESGLEFGEQDVLLVELPNEPGAFAMLLQRIAALGVSVRSAYATTSVRERALAVVITEDDDRVLAALGGD